jgi:hypothetical protein
MNIKSLEQMEKIVSNSKSLSWDGWTVVNSQKNDAAWMKPNGAFVRGQWYTQNKYQLNENGWDIPNKLVG